MFGVFLKTLRGITVSNQEESETLTDLARQDLRDSKTLKILSFIVVMDVPATLVLISSASNKMTRTTPAMENTLLLYPPKYWIYLIYLGKLDTSHPHGYIVAENELDETAMAK